MATKLREALEHLQTYGISCGSANDDVEQQGCLLTAIGLAHGITWKEILLYGRGSKRSIYCPVTEDHKRDVVAVANVITEQYGPQLMSATPFRTCYSFNDAYARNDPERILQVIEKATIKREEEI